MFARYTVDEIAEWQALYEIDPWGEERADLRSGYVAAAALNAAGHDCQPSKYMPEFDKKPEQGQTEDQMKAVLSGIAKVERKQ